ncbi:glycosyltransferase family 39 protein [Candidatus Saccharibacteria bacterium]|nr:glycosyltransferase family 39 protein [Candidatus Saccharibacteria bacterium]
MATVDFSKYFLYRWRYVIGYTAIGLLLAGLLIFSGLFLPGGLSEAEMAATVQSASLSLSDPSTLITPNLPYYGFQAIIFSMFGISTFTIKLPSLILALLSALGFIALLRRWFTPNIAVLASFIAVTTGQFLFIAQTGTPSILYIFWPVALLLLGTQITRVKRPLPLEDLIRDYCRAELVHATEHISSDCYRACHRLAPTPPHSRTEAQEKPPDYNRCNFRRSYCAAGLCRVSRAIPRVDVTGHPGDVAARPPCQRLLITPAVFLLLATEY